MKSLLTVELYTILILAQIIDGFGSVPH